MNPMHEKTFGHMS